MSISDCRLLEMPPMCFTLPRLKSHSELHPESCLRSPLRNVRNLVRCPPGTRRTLRYSKSCNCFLKVMKHRLAGLCHYAAFEGWASFEAPRALWIYWRATVFWQWNVPCQLHCHLPSISLLCLSSPPKSFSRLMTTAHIQWPWELVINHYLLHEFGWFPFWKCPATPGTSR